VLGVFAMLIRLELLTPQGDHDHGHSTGVTFGDHDLPVHHHTFRPPSGTSCPDAGGQDVAFPG
jgi:hypothetical protein